MRYGVALSRRHYSATRSTVRRKNNNNNNNNNNSHAAYWASSTSTSTSTSSLVNSTTTSSNGQVIPAKQSFWYDSNQTQRLLSTLAERGTTTTATSTSEAAAAALVSATRPEDSSNATTPTPAMLWGALALCASVVFGISNNGKREATTQQERASFATATAPGNAAEILMDVAAASSAAASTLAVDNAAAAPGASSGDKNRSSKQQRKRHGHYYPPFDYAAYYPSEDDDDTTTTTAAAHGKMATSAGGRKSSYDVSVRAIRGARITMEDEYLVADGGRFAAVFDGHGGGGVSYYLKKSLYDLIRSDLKKQQQEQERPEDDGSGSSGDDESLANDSADGILALSSHVEAIRSAFDRVERDVIRNDTFQYQGSTAVAVMVHEGTNGHRTLVSANVGDSRAVLSRKGRAVDLTRDHKPNEETEKARIMSMGESIEWDKFARVHRVKNLSLSRAIGDRYAKPVVSADVDIRHFSLLEDGGDEFFLLASDGLWDVMTSQEVVRFVHERMERELNQPHVRDEKDAKYYKFALRKTMAKFVAKEALLRGSGDNICVLMVWLNGSET